MCGNHYIIYATQNDAHVWLIMPHRDKNVVPFIPLCIVRGDVHSLDSTLDSTRGILICLSLITPKDLRKTYLVRIGQMPGNIKSGARQKGGTYGA